MSGDGRFYGKRTLMSISSFSSPESPSLHDVLSAHIKTCSACQDAMQTRPRGIGMRSNLCSDYQALIQAWADTEGRVNNVVAHDEFGNEAPRRGDPEKGPIRP